MSVDWDIDSYKTEFENEDHWELKRKFMLTHKDKFPEDELVCLAQVFTNIEFMGCRYPDKTMARVAELAKGVVEKYREARKNSLKRTFVTASDAASSKVKGSKNKEVCPPTKIQKIHFVKPENLGQTGQSEYSRKTESRSGSSFAKCNDIKTSNTCSKNFNLPIKVPEGPLGKIILMLNDSNHPISSLEQTASLNKCSIRWEIVENSPNSKCYNLYLENQFVVSATGENLKTAKENTATAAIDKLRKTNYAIKQKSNLSLETTVTTSNLGLKQKNLGQEISEDNVGRKLLKLMGWTGGGLGSRNQGIEEPIEATFKVQREGLGLSKHSNDVKLFKKKAKNYIMNWLNSDSVESLVFSNDFTSEERKILHEISWQFSLKSKSYGKNETRRLIISRKLTPWEILQDLQSAGGKTEKYELLYPTNLCP